MRRYIACQRLLRCVKGTYSVVRSCVKAGSGEAGEVALRPMLRRMLSFLIFVCDEQKRSLVCQDGVGRRIELPRAFDFRQRILRPEDFDQERRVPVVGAGQVWIEFDGAPELSVGIGYIQKSPELREGQCRFPLTSRLWHFAVTFSINK